MYLGIDIGGTKVLALAVSRKGVVLGRGKKKIKDRTPKDVLVRALQAALAALEDASKDLSAVKAVGLAVPSSVRDGRALNAPALGWRDVPVLELARKHFRCPIYLGNDVNLGVAAEYVHRSLQPHDILAGFFVGTGVGGAVIHAGQIVRGHDGFAGELGHIIVVPNGRRCGCGNAGCLEAYASKTALLARLREAAGKKRGPKLGRRRAPMITSSQLYAAYRDRDPVVKAVFDEGMQYLALAAASVINILSPSQLVLGGGIIEAFGPALVKKIRKLAAPHIFGDRGRAQVIVQSALGDDAVPAGAALLARRAGQLL
jgi:glucokinase